MKKAVITTGSKQYLVSEGETLEVELLHEKGKTASFDALMILDGENVKIGAPIVDGAKISAEIVEPDVQADKVTAIRFEAKKRVHKVHGHRQHHSRIKVTSIK